VDDGRQPQQLAGLAGRRHGPVPISNVIGRARFIVLPFAGSARSRRPTRRRPSRRWATGACAAPRCALGMIGLLPLVVCAAGSVSSACSCPGDGRDRGPSSSAGPGCCCPLSCARAGHRAPLRRQLDPADHAAPARARPGRGSRRGGPGACAGTARRRRVRAAPRRRAGASDGSPTRSCSPPPPARSTST
jgi:hypothetical protein